MKYFIGIDGGGTKTAYVVGNEKGEILFRHKTEGSSYQGSSIDAVLNQISTAVDYCLIQVNLKRENCAGMVVGLPCYGESKNEDQEIQEKAKVYLSGIPYHIVNDVEVGWAGSLKLRDGINVVAGTGSIAFGRNEYKQTARSGGWSTFFSDEGSCYWLGRRTMELFGKESDGRLPKGALHKLIIEQYQLKEDIDFIAITEQEIIPYREKVAQLQKILLEAAEQGDTSAIHLYHEASEELYLMILGVVQQLKLSGKSFCWSYSGGLFHAKKFVLPRLKEKVNGLGGKLIDPMATPDEGAFLLAKEYFDEVD